MHTICIIVTYLKRTIMKEKTENPITFRPTPSTREALHKAAHKADRSVSKIIEKCVRESLKLDKKR
jgi:uncharacterized protein (DUF1778 family)